jgi:HK97 family phage prohead protease
MAEHTPTGDEQRVLLSTKAINDLPDSAFAYIEPGGEKDAGGKTTPRSLRHYPVHDKAHATNALSRAHAAVKAGGAQADIAKKAMPAILAACKKFGVDVAEQNALLVIGEERSTTYKEKARNIADAIAQQPDGGELDVWMHDFDDDTATYHSGPDTFQVPYTEKDDGSITLGDPQKVKPVTTWQPVEGKAKRNPALAARPRGVTAELRAARDGMHGSREERRMPVQGFEMREATGSTGAPVIVCEGYASVTCADMQDDSNAYEMEDMLGPWVESTVRGFALKTIREKCDTAFLVNHGGVTMARTKPGTLALTEPPAGLRYAAELNPTRPDVQILYAAATDGAIDESSFAFQVTRQKWSDDYSRRWIQEISLHKGDVSPVNFGANPRTADFPLTMRSAVAVLAARGITWRSFGAALKELRAGKTLSSSTLDILQPILDDLAAIDKLVDADQPKLADLLGVANPDEPEVEPDADDAARVYVLPDFTTAASVQLAAMRSR